MCDQNYVNDQIFNGFCWKREAFGSIFQPEQLNKYFISVSVLLNMGNLPTFMLIKNWPKSKRKKKIRFGNCDILSFSSSGYCCFHHSIGAFSKRDEVLLRRLVLIAVLQCTIRDPIFLKKMETNILT